MLGNYMMNQIQKVTCLEHPKGREPTMGYKALIGRMTKLSLLADHG